MNRHTVFVAGKRFILLSNDKKEYVQELAREVNSAINKISSENPSLESRSCAILCALDYADDKNKEAEKTKRMLDNAKTVIQQSDKHAKQIKELKDALAQKDEALKKLEDELKELKAQAEKASAGEKPQTVKPSQPAPSKEKAKKNQHIHTNPYKEAAEAKKQSVAAEKGYVPQRQGTLFENGKN